MIEEGFNYADSTVKEMTDLSEIRIQNLEPKEDKKKFSASSKKMSKEKRPTRRGNKMTPTSES